ASLLTLVSGSRSGLPTKGDVPWPPNPVMPSYRWVVRGVLYPVLTPPLTVQPPDSSYTAYTRGLSLPPNRLCSSWRRPAVMVSASVGLQLSSANNDQVSWSCTVPLPEPPPSMPNTPSSSSPSASCPPTTRWWLPKLPSSGMSSFASSVYWRLYIVRFGRGRKVSPISALRSSR